MNIRSRLSVASAVAVALVASSASADILPVSRSSLAYSYLNTQPAAFTASTTSFDPFSAHFSFADQESSLSNTAISGQLYIDPMGSSSPMNPSQATATSSFSLSFHVDTATPFVITGDISFWGMTTSFRLTEGDANGTLLYAPTMVPNGPFGAQQGTISYAGLLVPGDYTLTAMTTGTSGGASQPYYGRINFEVNAAPTPGAAALGLLGLAGVAGKRRRR